MQTFAQHATDSGQETRNEADAHDPILFLQSLIRCNTVTRQGDEQALAEILASALRAAGNVEVSIHPIESGRCNLIARVKSERPGPRIVLSGHLDTVPIGSVPWTHDPFAADIVEGKLYGRGAVDMKSGLAALLHAFLRVARMHPSEWEGELIFAATSAEETGAEGAALMVESGQLPAFDLMIIAEPTNNELVVTHKGVLWLKLISHGKAAHGSMPSAGINAIEKMIPLHARLNERLRWELTHPMLGSATATVTMFQAGVQANVIPDRCEMTIDIRSLPGHDHESILQAVHSEINAAIEADPQSRFDVEVLLNLPALASSPGSPSVHTALDVLSMHLGRTIHARGAQYFTDASVFQRIGGDILIMGPGSPSLAHQVDEFVHVDDYLAAIDIYHKILLKLLSSTRSARPE